MEELVMKKRLLAVVLASLMAFSVSGNVSAEWKRDDASNWSWSENGVFIPVSQINSHEQKRWKDCRSFLGS